MISSYRMALLQTLDLVCILLALSISGFLTVESDLSIFHDYTGATLFTIFFYMLFFYILDAYSVGNEDFKETVGRVLVACQSVAASSTRTPSTSNSVARPLGAIWWAVKMAESSQPAEC